MTTPAQPPAPPPVPSAPDPVFASVEEWMDGYFTPMFQRPVGGQLRWCPRWWAHPEAVTRLTALWRSWESYRLEPATGISDWLRDHLDYHMSVLLSATGPFYQCDEVTGHLAGRPFTSDPVDYAELGGGS